MSLEFILHAHILEEVISITAILVKVIVGLLSVAEELRHYKTDHLTY
jgi:hypothetical protein